MCVEYIHVRKSIWNNYQRNWNYLAVKWSAALRKSVAEENEENEEKAAEKWRRGSGIETKCV